MKQETQITRASLPPAPTDDPWGSLATTDGGGQQNPFRMLHKVLRGRYPWVIALALLFGTVGAVLGYRSQHPQYRSDGIIAVNPVVTSWIEANERVHPAHNAIMDQQVALIRSQRLMDMATSSPEWQELGRGKDPRWMREFGKNLAVRQVGSSLIRVSYTDHDQDAAAKTVQAVIEAYKSLSGDAGTNELRRRIDLNQQHRGRLQGELLQEERALQDVATRSGYHTDSLDHVQQQKLTELVRAESAYLQARLNRSAAEAALGLREGEAITLDPSDVTVPQIARVDQTMREIMNQIAAQEILLQQMERALGDQHPLVRRGRHTLELYQARLDEWANFYRENYAELDVNRIGAQNPVILVLRLRDEELRLRELYEQQQRDVVEIGRWNFEIRRARHRIARVQQELTDTNRRLELLEARAEMANEIVIVSEGDYPYAPSTDRRRQMAAVGFVGGGALPVALLVLIGLLDHRFRYSDEAGSESSGITLLGILPNLPDRLSDPEQAAIAAHCVHQIRTMLQLTAPAEQRRVFAVTSASPGDGKTSLTLALGLSFAASGSRVLLIDCDLVGGGLTGRLDVHGPDGVLEAMNNQSLLEYVQSTDVADVSILPVGAAHAHHASTVSPLGMKQLIDEARKHFDVVVIDTGPILGSIEASPVCATADGVILVVARGQQRPLVERAMQRLNGIGAGLAGVVFNRAQPRDLHPSINRLSIRAFSNLSSRKASQQGDGEQFGPVVRAVATNVKPSNGHNHG